MPLTQSTNPSQGVLHGVARCRTEPGEKRTLLPSQNPNVRHTPRAFCGLLATLGDFIHRDRYYLSTASSSSAQNHKAADEESRFGDWRTPKGLPSDLSRRTVSRSDAKGIIVGVHDRQS